MTRQKVKGTKVRRPFRPSDEPNFYGPHWEDQTSDSLDTSAPSKMAGSSAVAFYPLQSKYAIFNVQQLYELFIRTQTDHASHILSDAAKKAKTDNVTIFPRLTGCIPLPHEVALTCSEQSSKQNMNSTTCKPEGQPPQSFSKVIDSARIQELINEPNPSKTNPLRRSQNGSGIEIAPRSLKMLTEKSFSTSSFSDKEDESTRNAEVDLTSSDDVTSVNDHESPEGGYSVIFDGMPFQDTESKSMDNKDEVSLMGLSFPSFASLSVFENMDSDSSLAMMTHCAKDRCNQIEGTSHPTGGTETSIGQSPFCDWELEQDASVDCFKIVAL